MILSSAPRQEHGVAEPKLMTPSASARCAAEAGLATQAVAGLPFAPTPSRLWRWTAELAASPRLCGASVIVFARSDEPDEAAAPPSHQGECKISRCRAHSPL